MFKIERYYSEKKYCYATKNSAFEGYIFDKCPSCGRTVATSIPKKQNDAFIVVGGKEYPDFLQFGGPGLYFVFSDKVLNAFEKYNVTGYDQAVEVPIYRQQKDALCKQPFRYYMVNITGIVDFDLKAMSLKRKNLCSHCGQFDWNRQRLSIIKTVLDMTTWNGSDLCRIDSFPGIIVCTEKIKRIAEEHQFKGITFLDEDSIFRSY